MIFILLMFFRVGHAADRFVRPEPQIISCGRQLADANVDMTPFQSMVGTGEHSRAAFRDLVAASVTPEMLARAMEHLLHPTGLNQELPELGYAYVMSESYQVLHVIYRLPSEDRTRRILQVKDLTIPQYEASTAQNNLEPLDFTTPSYRPSSGALTSHSILFSEMLPRMIWYHGGFTMEHLRRAIALSQGAVTGGDLQDKSSRNTYFVSMIDDGRYLKVRISMFDDIVLVLEAHSATREQYEGYQNRLLLPR